MNLNVDPQRVGQFGSTGILVRARHPHNGWCSADIADLDAPSLLAWLRSRGGENKWAESVVGMLLGHEAILHAGASATKEEPVPLTPAQAKDVLAWLRHCEQARSFTLFRTGNDGRADVAGFLAEYPNVEASLTALRNLAESEGGTTEGT